MAGSGGCRAFSLFFVLCALYFSGSDARAGRNEHCEFAGLPRGRRPARAVLRTAGGSSQTKLSLKDTAARLFREATQLKTEATVSCGIRIETSCTEIQIQTAVAFCAGGVVESVVADTVRRARSCVAEARSGFASRLFREATQLKTVGTKIRTAGAKIL